MLTTPSPAALVIANIIENALAPVFAAMAAPLIARVDKLENVVHLGEPSPSFIGKVRDAVMADENFDEAVRSAVLTHDHFDDAVLGVIDDRSSDVIEKLGEAMAANTEGLSDRVSNVLRDGTFSISFDRY